MALSRGYLVPLVELGGSGVACTKGSLGAMSWRQDGGHVIELMVLKQEKITMLHLQFTS
jgi:hypothetical protein